MNKKVCSNSSQLNYDYELCKGIQGGGCLHDGVETENFEFNHFVCLARDLDNIITKFNAFLLLAILPNIAKKFRKVPKIPKILLGNIATIDQKTFKFCCDILTIPLLILVWSIYL